MLVGVDHSLLLSLARSDPALRVLDSLEASAVNLMQYLRRSDVPGATGVVVVALCDGVAVLTPYPRDCNSGQKIGQLLKLSSCGER